MILRMPRCPPARSAAPASVNAAGRQTSSSVQCYARRCSRAFEATGTLIRVTPDVVLKPGEVLQYLDGQGFSVLDPFAQRKASGSLAQGVVSDTPSSLAEGATEPLSLTPRGRLRVSSVQSDTEKVWQNTTDDPWGCLNNQWNMGDLYV